MRIVFVALCLLWSSALFAADETYQQIMRDRASYGRVIHLFGDSIFRGWALTVFPEEASDEVKASPKWALRSPGVMLGLMLGDATVAGYASQLGLPYRQDVANRIDHINNLVDTGIIRSDDVVVFEDAGVHASDPDLYEDLWRGLFQAVSGKARVFVVDMFDYLTQETYGDLPSDAYRFGVTFQGTATGRWRSHNDATKAAATQARVEILPLNAAMGRFRDDVLKRYKIDVVHSDGIHPNIWGQCLVSAMIARAAHPGFDQRPRSALLRAFREAEPRTKPRKVDGLVSMCLSHAILQTGP